MTVTINGTTGVSGVAGSASTPALIGSDADSGYYINSANEPNASVNGTAVWSAASTFGFKNRIINGAMVIDQRNAGSMVSVTTGETYSVDRFFARFNAGSYTATQGQSSTAPTGFRNSFLVNVTTGGTVSSTTRGTVLQRIEGYNWADMGYGAVGASTSVLSFWVRSSLTGTFSGGLSNSAGDRSYVFTYTISSANTWEYKTITIAGDTTGTWLTTNGIGMSVSWDLGNGSSLQTSTTGSWIAGDYRGATGSVAPFANSGATWYITGVQFEKGSTATSFDYRPYGTELQLCQRYFWNRLATGSENPGVCNLSLWTTTSTYGNIPFPVPMRTDPTFSYSSLSHFTTFVNSSIYTPTAISSGVSTNNATPTGSEINFAHGVSVGTGGQAGFSRITTLGGYFSYSAEL